jgi:glycosyltransferase involved in cell wall biosynthesis
LSVPSVSCVIPTLNSERTLDRCLASIRAQDYAGEIEIVLADAGSSDRTLELARTHGVDRIVDNPGQTGETGKAAGIRAARGEILAFVDSDNVLVGRDWMTRMTAPFADPTVVSTEALRWDYSSDYGLIDRYCALTGVNDPASIFIGNYGRYSFLTGRWTGFPVEEEQVTGYLRVRVDPDLLPTMGANGYLVRRDAFRSVVTGDHLFDIDAVGELARHGHDVVARVDVAVGHLFAPSYRVFARKTRRRARDYLYYAGRGERTYPWQRYRRGLVLFVLATVTTVPLLVQAAIGYVRRPDRAWWFHPVACWTTLAIYGWETLRVRFRPERLSRRGWQQ